MHRVQAVEEVAEEAADVGEEEKLKAAGAAFTKRDVDTPKVANVGKAADDEHRLVEDEGRTVQVRTSEGKITVLEPWFMEFVRRHGDTVPYHLSEDGLEKLGSTIYLDGTEGSTFSEPALQGVLQAATFLAKYPEKAGSPDYLLWAALVHNGPVHNDAKNLSHLLHAFGLADFWALPSVRMECHESLIRHIDFLLPCCAADFGEDISRQYDIFMRWMGFIKDEEFVTKGQMSTEIQTKLARCQDEMMRKEDKEEVGRGVPHECCPAQQQ